MLGRTTITFAWWARAIEDEYIEEALKPATARATTKARMARVFICVFLLGGITAWIKLAKISKIFLWTTQM